MKISPKNFGPGHGLFWAFCALGLLLLPWQTHGQDPLRFEKEVTALLSRTDSLWDRQQPAIVFTGSSSIRMWNTLSRDFPEVQILNTGFGGSQASDLLHYLDALVLQYSPAQVFIYEGDNDLAEGKRPRQVLKTLETLTMQIQNEHPRIPVVWIAAKPSISRWHLRGKYRRFNRKLERKARKTPAVDFANVWHPMLNERRLKTGLFIEDGLHMNAEGYRIWREVIGPKLKTTDSTN